MPKIAKLTPITSIKPGAPPQIAPEGTILNPVLYEAADITFDDGITVQVERPLTVAKLQTAWAAARKSAVTTIDGIATDTVIPVPPP